MQIYDLINFSDNVTFAAPSLSVAAASTMILSSVYGAQCVDDSIKIVPIFCLFSEEKRNSWFDVQCGKSFEDITRDHLADIVSCLLSFVYGTPEDRTLYFKTLAMLKTSQHKQEFISHWNDAHRSSMNEIVKSAHSMGHKIQSAMQGENHA